MVVYDVSEHMCGLILVCFCVCLFCVRMYFVLVHSCNGRYFPPRKGKRVDWEANPKVVVTLSMNTLFQSVCGCMGREPNSDGLNISICLNVRRAWCVRSQNFMDQYGTKPEYLKNLHFACVGTSAMP